MRDSRVSWACVAAVLTSVLDRRAGGVVAPVGGVARRLHRRQRLEPGDRGGQVLALARARLLAAEVEAVDVGLRREAAGAREQAPAASRRAAAGRRPGALTSPSSETRRVCRDDRDAHVLLAVDGDDVAGRERDVVGLVALQHDLAEVERDHLRAEVGVEALDRRVVPVELVEQRRRRAPGAVRGERGRPRGCRGRRATRSVDRVAVVRRRGRDRVAVGGVACRTRCGRPHCDRRCRGRRCARRGCRRALREVGRRAAARRAVDGAIAVVARAAARSSSSITCTSRFLRR